MQVSLYLAHYWIIPAESYSQHYLELDSSRFAYSASGCHMGASAFIFLALYCLNKDPHCFLFSKPHPQSNKLFHWRKKNTASQGNRTHRPAEKREEGENASTAPRHAEIPNRVLTYNLGLNLTASGAATSFSLHWVKPPWTWSGPLWLSLISPPLQRSCLGMQEVQNSNYRQIHSFW